MHVVFSSVNTTERRTPLSNSMRRAMPVLHVMSFGDATRQVSSRRCIDVKGITSKPSGELHRASTHAGWTSSCIRQRRHRVAFDAGSYVHVRDATAPTAMRGAFISAIAPFPAKNDR
ncbi:hypothetical protein [Burkholderia latens]|uniref:hypothetical protein n=1 Tax=Burkholderia latens TaxID=488446 RepID=UPI001C96E4E5|nr:hypothetical protein [Burkholderia latens]